ncbi:MAG: DUF4349 domain-containing protein [Ruminococcus sp.]|nr:DUF4349 domain-containing protein [Ruminococcus sp.]
MNRKFMCRLLSLLLVILLVCFTLTACGSASKGDYAVEEHNGAVVDDSLADDAVGDLSTGSSASSTTESEKSIKDQRKIIERIYYQTETKDFDNLVNTLESQALSVGGYIESSDVYGNVYSSSTLRSASFVFRIPNDKVTEFTDFVSDNSTVTNRSVNTEDVTLDYVDAESRIKALKTEKEALESLLAKATSTTELLEIRDMLTDVIYEIETYESQLRTYDNLIDYTTITVDVNEVEHTAVVHKQTTWERIGTNLKDNFRGIWNFLVELFVFVVSALPYLLFVGVIVVIIILIVKSASKKRKKSKMNPTVVQPVQYSNFPNNPKE